MSSSSSRDHRSCSILLSQLQLATNLQTFSDPLTCKYQVHNHANSVIRACWKRGAHDTASALEVIRGKYSLSLQNWILLTEFILYTLPLRTTPPLTHWPAKKRNP